MPPLAHAKPGAGRKVVVAMSGGVDSSVTAALLQQEGYEVVGCFMRLGSADSIEGPHDDPGTAACPGAAGDACDAGETRHGPSAEPEKAVTSPKKKANRQGCCSVNDAADARMVAAILGVPFYVVNFKRDFGRIMDYFVGEYNAGRTPNPCVRCNDWLKFGKLAEYARSIDADYIASGHYARIERDAATGEAALYRGVDHHKDQSYVLFGTQRDRLSRMLLPIGRFRKAQVRTLAEQLGLPVFDKPDSYEICFIPDNDYRGFVQRRTPDAVEPGAMLDTDGNVVGEHGGHQNFTIGQRRGLSVTMGRPVYVVEKDASANTVTLGDRCDMLATGLEADQTNWLIDPPGDWSACSVKVRANSEPVPGRVKATGDGTLAITFDEPLDAVTPGQAAVCYHGERLIGGGWITRATR